MDKTIAEILRIDKISCLCLDGRWPEWTALKPEVEETFCIPMECFIVGPHQVQHGGHYDAKLEDYDLVDEINPDISQWQYGRPGYKHHHYNAFKSHQAMIRRAKEEGVKRLLLLEDDVYLLRRLETVIRYLDKHQRIPVEYDCLYLGWWAGTETDQWNTDIEKAYEEHGTCNVQSVYSIAGLHSVIINHSMFDYLLSLRPINPIDSQLCHDLLRSYFIKPKLTHIKTIYSFCEGSAITRLPLL